MDTPESKIWGPKSSLSSIDIFNFLLILYYKIIWCNGLICDLCYVPSTPWVGSKIFFDLVGAAWPFHLSFSFIFLWRRLANDLFCRSHHMKIVGPMGVQTIGRSRSEKTGLADGNQSGGVRRHLGWGCGPMVTWELWNWEGRNLSSLLWLYILWIFFMGQWYIINLYNQF